MGMAILNQEALYVYRRTVMEWFEGRQCRKGKKRIEYGERETRMEGNL